MAQPRLLNDGMQRPHSNLPIAHATNVHSLLLDFLSSSRKLTMKHDPSGPRTLHSKSLPSSCLLHSSSKHHQLSGVMIHHSNSTIHGIATHSLRPSVVPLNLNHLHYSFQQDVEMTLTVPALLGNIIAIRSIAKSVLNRHCS